MEVSCVQTKVSCVYEEVWTVLWGCSG